MNTPPTKTFADYCRVLFERKWLIVALVLLVEIFIFLQNLALPPRYAASAQLWVVSQKEREIPYAKELTSYRGILDIARSQSEVVKSRAVLYETVRLLHLTDRPRPPASGAWLRQQLAPFIRRYHWTEQIATALLGLPQAGPGQSPDPVEHEVDTILRKGCVSVSVLPETSIIEIRTVDSDPAVAARMANTLAQVFIVQDIERLIVDLSRTYRPKHPKIVTLTHAVQEARKALERSPGAPDALALIASDIKIVEPAVPAQYPFAPRKNLNLVLGLILSLGFGLALAFLLDQMDQRVRTPDDLEACTAVPCLGSLSRLGRIDLLLKRHLAGRELMQLASSLYALVTRQGARRLLVASLTAGEGKSLLSFGLACALAQRFKLRVVWVDLNLRHPAAPDHAGPRRAPGLAECLAGKATLDEIVQPGPHEGLLVVPAGLARTGVPMLTEKTLGTLLQQLESRADLVLLDGMAHQSSPEVLLMGRESGAVLLAVRAGWVRKKALQRFVRLLEENQVPVLGTALTFRQFKIPPALYRRL